MASRRTSAGIWRRERDNDRAKRKARPKGPGSCSSTHYLATRLIISPRANLRINLVADQIWGSSDAKRPATHPGAASWRPVMQLFACSKNRRDESDRQEARLRARGRTIGAIRAALESANGIFVEENGEGPGLRLRKGVSKQ